jgi:hypothetical protein
MPEQLLYRADVVAVLQQVGGETVPQRVAPDRTVDACRPASGPHCPLDAGRMQVMAAPDAGARAGREIRGREHEAPGEFLPGVRVLPGERMRQLHVRDAAREIALEEPPAPGDGPSQARGECIGQDRAPILVALPAAHRELPPLEVQVLHPQAQCLRQAQAAAVEQRRHDGLDSVQLREQAPDLLPRQHERKPGPSPSLHEVGEFAGLATQHVAVEEHHRTERLMLRRRGDRAADREVLQERADAGRTERAGPPRPVETDVAAGPVHVLALGGEAVVADAQGLAQTLLEILGGFGHDCMVQTGRAVPPQ